MPRPEGNRAKRAADTSAGPWTRWRGSRASKAIRFIQTYVRPPRGVGSGKRLRLLRWEKEFVEAFLANEIGAGGLSIPRGNGKSTLGAGLATWGAFVEDDMGAPQVPVIATTMGQAIRAVYGQVVSIVRAEPELADRSLIFTGIGSSRIEIPRTGGSVFPISSDTDGLQGLDIYPLGIADEWGFLSREAWSALLMARKRPGARVLGMGTPGLDRDNPLYAIRKLYREGAELPGFVLQEFSGEPGADVHDEANWLRANPSLAEAGFPSAAFLRQALELTPEAHFRIFHLGEFDVDGVESWLGADGRAVWRALSDPWGLVPGAPTWIGLDVALKRDSTAVVAVQYREDGRLHSVCRLWVPAKDEPVDVRDVMAYLREMAEAYKVGAISYDPRFFDVPARILHDEGLPMVEVPQSVERMTAAIGALYELIRTGGLSHDGDEAFEHQVLNAVPRLNERGFTLQKAKSRGRIDAAIALALAVDRAQHRSKPRAPLAVI